MPFKANFNDVTFKVATIAPQLASASQASHAAIPIIPWFSYWKKLQLILNFFVMEFAIKKVNYDTLQIN